MYRMFLVSFIGLLATVPTAHAAVSATWLSWSETIFTPNDTIAQDYVRFKARFEVTATDNDVYINFARQPVFSIVLGLGNQGPASGSIASVLTRVSGGNQLGNTIEIFDGETSTLDFTIIYTPTQSNFYGAWMHSLLYTESMGGTELTLPLTPTEDWRSRSMFVRGVPEPTIAGVLMLAGLVGVRRTR